MAKKDPEWFRQLRAFDNALELVLGKRLTFYGAYVVEKLAPFFGGSRPKPPTNDPNDPYRVLDIPSNSPDWLVKLAYKAKAKKAHPDAGGSEEDMKRINDAYQKIREERPSLN